MGWPYIERCFASTSETDIEHMVALHQAHHSGLCTAERETKRTFAGDLPNLTLAAPEVNRQNGARDRPDGGLQRIVAGSRVELWRSNASTG